MIFGRKKMMPSKDSWSDVESICSHKGTPHCFAIFDKNVHQEIERYCHLDLKNEVGGVLVGQYGPFLEILGAVEAKYAEHKAASLTFTHASWEYIHSVVEKKFSGLKIVGWFHTHPGYGIFLSNYDLFIQNNFFNDKQVALVVDPCQDQRGLFACKGNKTERISSYQIGRYLKEHPLSELSLETEAEARNE